MRILPPVEEEMRRAIRDARAADPLISVSGLEKVLEQRFNRGFSRKYIAKLADKVFRQALIEADRTSIEQRLNTTREKFRYASDRLVEVLQSKPADEDTIEAAKNLAMLDLALLKAEIECGMYKKPNDVIAREFQYDPLPAEVRTVVIAAWTRGGLLPATTVEKIVPVKLTPDNQL
jgi:hypothetical protein